MIWIAHFFYITKNTISGTRGIQLNVYIYIHTHAHIPLNDPESMWRPERKSQANFFGGFNFFGGLIIKEPWAIPDNINRLKKYKKSIQQFKGNLKTSRKITKIKSEKSKTQSKRTSTGEKSNKSKEFKNISKDNNKQRV